MATPLLFCLMTTSSLLLFAHAAVNQTLTPFVAAEHEEERRKLVRDRGRGMVESADAQTHASTPVSICCLISIGGSERRRQLREMTPSLTAEPENPKCHRGFAPLDNLTNVFRRNQPFSSWKERSEETDDKCVKLIHEAFKLLWSETMT